MRNLHHIGFVLPVLWVVAAGGCSELAINPFVDDSTSDAGITTASERSLRAQSVSPTVRERGWEETRLAAADGGVTHWPLWFEDPFEDKGSTDGRFAWTVEDYVAYPYCFSRWVLNNMGFPVSLVVTPPFTPMVSDGELSRQALGADHDATYLKRGENCQDAAPPEPRDEEEAGTSAQSTD